MPLELETNPEGSLKAFDVVFGGYLLSRIDALKDENKQLRQKLSGAVVKSPTPLSLTSPKLSTVEFETKHVDISVEVVNNINNTPVESGNKINITTVQSENGLHRRVIAAAESVARAKILPAHIRPDLDIHSVGRRLTQLVKGDKASQIIEILRSNPKCIEFRSSSLNGQTLLHIAAANGATATCIALLDYGKNQNDSIGDETVSYKSDDPLVSDMLGRTPLHCAAEILHVDTCRLFISRFPWLRGETAPQDLAGLTPSGCCSMASVKSKVDAEKRIQCLDILHVPGDKCISPSPMRSAKGGKAKTPKSASLHRKIIQSDKRRLRFDDDAEINLTDTIQGFNLNESDIIDYGLCEMPGFRVTMEDASFASPFLKFGDPVNGIEVSLFGVFDGHGGAGASRFCAKYATEFFTDAMELNNNYTSDKVNSVVVALEKCVETLENRLSQADEFQLKNVIVRPAMGGEPALEELQAQDDSGTTLLLAAVFDHQVLVANVGDCRAIYVGLFKDNGKMMVEVNALSRDHKPHNTINGIIAAEDIEFFAAERERVERAGGIITADDYVLWNPIKSKDKLNMTRSIGDFKFKSIAGIKREDQPVVYTPEITILDIKAMQNNNKYEKFLILMACDGLWDVMSNQYVGDFIGAQIDTFPDKTMDDLCNDLLIESLRRKTQDNLTALIIDIPLPKAHKMPVIFKPALARQPLHQLPTKNGSSTLPSSQSQIQLPDKYAPSINQPNVFTKSNKFDDIEL